MLAQSAAQSPSASLSWKPASQPQVAVPEASEQEALAPQGVLAQSAAQSPSASLSWKPALQPQVAVPVASEQEALVPQTTESQLAVQSPSASLSWKPALQPQVAVPVASSQEVLRPQVVFTQSVLQSPSPSLSWVPAAHAQDAVPVASSQTWLSPRQTPAGAAQPQTTSDPALQPAAPTPALVASKLPSHTSASRAHTPGHWASAAAMSKVPGAPTRQRSPGVAVGKTQPHTTSEPTAQPAAVTLASSVVQLPFQTSPKGSQALAHSASAAL